MKGKIERNGYLYIFRPGVGFKYQSCPYDAGQHGPSGCGDWCPLFGEPQGAPDDLRTLRLCHTNLMFDEFTDEREGGSNE